MLQLRLELDQDLIDQPRGDISKNARILDWV